MLTENEQLERFLQFLDEIAETHRIQTVLNMLEMWQQKGFQNKDINSVFLNGLQSLGVSVEQVQQFLRQIDKGK
jgi:hypothetical protein